MSWLKSNLQHCYMLSTLALILTAIPAHGADEMTVAPFTIAAIDSTSEALIMSLVDRLGGALDESGQRRPQTILAVSRSDLIDMIDDGVADVVISDVRVAVEAMSQNPMITTFRVAGPSSDFAPVVFAVKDDSTIQTLDDLKGQTITFEGIWNRSGYFAPTTHLMRVGHKMEYLDSVRDVRNPEATNFVFAGDELNMVAWLDRGLVDALAFSRTDWAHEKKTPPHIREKLRLIVDEDVSMDYYVTLTSREAIRQSDAIRQALVADGVSASPVSLLTSDEAYQLDFLVETLVQTEGNYLAHE